MALFPCDSCGKRYVGAGNLAYAGWMAGSYSERKRFRLCPAHAAEFRDLAERQMRLVQLGDLTVTFDEDGDKKCWECRMEPHTITAFMHLYARDDEVRVYVMSTCAKCNSRHSLDALVAA